MINLTVVLAIIVIHWFADFVLQTDKQARGKSKNWNDLLSHTFTYSVCWFTPIIFLSIANNHFLHHPPSYYGWDYKICLFPIITFVCHTITDYFTSRLNSKLWAKGDVHNFFVSVGFDQVLHYVQLFLTYYLLTK